MRKLPRLAVGIGGLVLVAALVWMQRAPGNRVESLQLPFRPPVLPPELTPSPDLPAGPGALRNANLLLVTLDTTRADRIGIYGNGDIETPHLDALARDGVVFSHAMATAPTTLPTHASIFTGLYPAHHGARVNGIFPLGSKPATLAESLRSAGYATAAIVSSFVLDARFGLARGFDAYDDDFDHEGARRRRPQRTADDTTDRALAWLGGQAHRPFFLWVHYFDPHAGYAPPAPYGELYPGNPYDGEIAFVDSQVGRLLEGLEDGGDGDRTVVVVVADHGESLGDHGEAMHGFLLYDATLRVPLVMRGPEGLRGGVHVTRPVSQIDLMPTLLSLLGAPVPENLDGVDLTRVGADERTLFAETLQGQIEYGWASLRAAMRGGYKWIDAPVPELYDRASDPGELRNLPATAPERAASLEAALLGLHQDDPELEATAAALSPDEIEHLEALGYGAGAARSERPRDQRPNPVEMVPVLLQVQKIGLAVGSGLPPHRAVAALDEIVQEHPDFVPASLLLAHVQEEDGHPEAAAETLRRATAVSGGAEMVVLLLAQILSKSDQIDEALSHLDELVARRPQSFEARLNLGSLLLASGRVTEALPHLRTAYALDPDDEKARRLLTRGLDQSGRHDEAAKIPGQAPEARAASPPEPSARVRRAQSDGQEP